MSHCHAKMMARFLLMTIILSNFVQKKEFILRINMSNKPSQGTSSGTKVRERVLIEEPHQYKVVFHNDDFTTMEFVTEVLRVVFKKPVDEAVALMMKVHREGQAIVGIYSYDVAMTKAAQATAMARSEGFPLQITCEPE
jgi:ATP-dependent Clp protease adaptor protein ClpS